MAWAVPDRFQPAPASTMWVKAVDVDGRLVHDLQGPGDWYQMVTGVREVEGTVYLGSLEETSVAVLENAGA